MFTSDKGISAAIATGLLFVFMSPLPAQLQHNDSQSMSPEARSRHQQTMHSLSPAERETYRARHHEEMKRRAESMGVYPRNQPLGSGRSLSPWGPGYSQGGTGYWWPNHQAWRGPNWGPNAPGRWANPGGW